MRPFIVATLLVMAASPGALAQSDDAGAAFDAAMQLLAEGEFDKARAAFEPIAAKGDASAQYVVGILNLRGWGMRSRNPGEARVWFERAAKQNQIQSQFELGLIYFNGDGTKPHLESAIVWFRKAALRGEPGAAFNMAATAYNGEGVETNLVDAYAWARLAKELGHRGAPALITRIEDELGADARAAAAKRWTDLDELRRTAATGGVSSFQYDFSGAANVAYEKGEKAYLDRRYEDALRYLAPLVQNGHGAACFYLARMLQMGRGVKEDHPAAARYYAMAIRADSISAIYNLGILYARGNEMKHDLGRAVDLFEAAAWRGDAGAMTDFADALMRGVGRKRDDVMAYAWFKAAATRGNEHAQKMEKIAREELPEDVIRKGVDAHDAIETKMKLDEIPRLPGWLYEER